MSARTIFVCIFGFSIESFYLYSADGWDLHGSKLLAVIFFCAMFASAIFYLAEVISERN